MNFLAWLPLFLDIFKVAAPIVQAHTSGNASKIAGAVESAAQTLGSAVQASTPTAENPTAATIQSGLDVAAPIVEGVISEFTTPSGHTVTTTVTAPK